MERMLEFLPSEEKEEELKIFRVSVKTPSGPFVELIPAADERQAVERMGRIHPSLTKQQLAKAETDSITKEEYGKIMRQEYAIRNNLK